MDPPPTSPECHEDGIHRLRQDHPCVGCGYNLRTLPHAGICPECGRPVGDSTRKGVLIAPREVLLRIRKGASLLSWIPLFTYGGIALVLFIYSVFSPKAPKIVPWEALMLVQVIIVLAIWGSFHVSTPVLNQVRWPAAPRVLTRYSALSLLLVPMIAIAGGMRSEFALSCLAALLGLWFTSAAWLVRRIALSADDEMMGVHAAFVIALGAATLIIPVVLWIAHHFGAFQELRLLVVAMVALEPILLFSVAILLAVLMNGLVQLVDKSLEGDIQ